MPIDFSLPSHVEQSRRDIADFIDTVVIPREQAVFAGGLTDAVRRELQSATKAAGIWAPQADAELRWLGAARRAHEIAMAPASGAQRMSMAKRAARRAAATPPQLVGP